MIITSHSKGKHKALPIKLYLTEENTCNSNKKILTRKAYLLVWYLISNRSNAKERKGNMNKKSFFLASEVGLCLGV